MVVTLCALCTPLGGWVMEHVTNAENYETDLTYQHHASWRDLLHSASQGCPFCQHIYAYFDIRGSYRGLGEELIGSFGDTEDRKGSETWIEQINRYDEIGYSTQITIGLILDGDGHLCLPIVCAEIGWADLEQGLYPYLSFGDSAASLSPVLKYKDHLNADPMCDATMVIIKSWLSECLNTHDTCQPLDKGFVPMRLVDVAIDGETPFLVETKKMAEYSRFVALSHCWGKTQHVRTLLDNLHQYKQALPYEMLSKTFKDAIYITRRLGLRYLWIDSLCIVQDSTEDWAANAADMGTIYASSTLTVAATDAPDGDHGFLNPRQPPCALTYSMKAPEDGEVHGKVWIDSWAPFFYDHIPFSIINSRAWVTQERHLPARLLHAGNVRLMWECQRQALVESKPQFSVQYTQSEDTEKIFAPQLLRAPETTSDAREKRYELFDTWRFLVDDYSKKNLTFIKDRLPAISGLAKLFQRATMDTYCAGLWLGDISHGLCWEPSVPWKRPEVFTAPSWSWASFATGISYPPFARDSISFIEDVEISTTPLTDTNKLGAISEGYLRCSALIRSATLVPTPDGPTRVNLALDSQDELLEFLGTTELEISYRFNLKPVCLLISERENWKPNKVQQANKKLSRVTRVLLLEAVENSTDTYRRIGIVNHATYFEEWLNTKRRMIKII